MTLAPARGNAHRLDGKVVVVTDDERGIAGELVPLLEWCGAVAKVVDAGPLPAADVVVHLAGVRPGAPGHLPRAAAELAGLVATPLRDGLGQLLVLSGLGGRFGIGMPADGWPDALAGTGLGLRGLVKTVVQEHPGTITHLVDVDLGAGPVAVSRWLAAELVADDPVVEVGYDGDRRVGLRMVPDPLPQHGSPAEVAGPGHVALLTGGARGITSRVAIDLAVHGTVVELVGRTPMADEPEPPELALCPDTVALRQALAVGGGLDRSAIERRVAGVLAQRELRATAAALDAAGARWQYHVADVRDRDAVSAVVADVVGRHGTIDLVVHGAGVLEDRLLVDKTPESFERVWSTKVDGAANVLAALQALRTRPAAVVLFGSIAGAFGNRGQCDYAAANDALEAVARSATGKVAERVVCVHWGPWAASGMVSAGVADRFARRGICLVEPEDGLLHLARELALGPAAQAVVVVSRALPASLLGTTNTAANTARPPGGGSAGQNRRGASGRAPRP
jgi:NAD(P)-dependent dehydrogenase (short-subunit alcohol dehydrogenase family)